MSEAPDRDPLEVFLALGALVSEARHSSRDDLGTCMLKAYWLGKGEMTISEVLAVPARGPAPWETGLRLVGADG
jgi:hypothetical protein